MSILSVQDLRKVYKSGTEALKGVSLSVEPGEFTALLGPNGAGKTTLINTLIGNTMKTSGQVTVDETDLDIDPLKVKYSLGVVPQEIGLDHFFSVNEVLLNQSGYFGIRNNQTYIDELLEALGLSDKKHTNSRDLSGGMKRRLIIARALVHKPKIFILDEPTAGVDIELRQSLYEYLEHLHSSGTTIILTTHYLEEAERLCDRIIVINEGEIKADGDKKELLGKFSACNAGLQVVFHAIPSNIGAVLEGLNYEVRGNTVLLRVGKQEMPEVFKRLESNQTPYEDFHVREPRLEDLFVHLVHS